MPTFNPGSPGGGSNTNNPLPSTKKTNPAPKSKKTTPAGPTLYKQPVFDKRMRTLSWPMQGGVPGAEQQDFGPAELQRGLIVWDKAPSGYSAKATVDFLFNPTTVSASYDIDASDVSSSLLYRTPGDTAQPVFAMNQSVSLSLYYDRTFELWGSYDSSGNPRAKPTGTTGSTGGGIGSTYDLMDASVYGVEVDILAFKQITGQMAGATATAAGAGPGYSPGISQQGVMTIIPSWMFIGSSAGGGGLSYYGYVSSVSVTVTHFTQWMIPQRCIIDVSFALLVPPTNEPGGPSFTDWMKLAELQQDVKSGGGFVI